MTTNTIELRAVGEQFTAVVFGKGGRNELGGWVPDAIETARRYCQRWGAGPVGDPFIRFVDGEIEVGFAATTPVGGEGDVEPSDLPAGSAVVTTIEPDADADVAIVQLRGWIADHDAVPQGFPWEVLIDGTPDGRREVIQVYRSAV